MIWTCPTCLPIYLVVGPRQPPESMRGPSREPSVSPPSKWEHEQATGSRSPRMRQTSSRASPNQQGVCPYWSGAICNGWRWSRNRSSTRSQQRLLASSRAPLLSCFRAILPLSVVVSRKHHDVSLCGGMVVWRHVVGIGKSRGDLFCAFSVE